MHHNLDYWGYNVIYLHKAMVRLVEYLIKNTVAGNKCNQREQQHCPHPAWGKDQCLAGRSKHTPGLRSSRPSEKKAAGLLADHHCPQSQAIMHNPWLLFPQQQFLKLNVDTLQRAHLEYPWQQSPVTPPGTLKSPARHAILSTRLRSRWQHPSTPLKHASVAS